MDYERIERPDGLEIRVPRDDEHRTCTTCGGDCVPETGDAKGLGIRIVFSCPDHGVQSIVDPFHDLR